MGILESAKPAIVICTRDRARATAFYRDTLGLTVAYEDSFAAVFNIGGVTLRVCIVADFTPHEHTILGFNALRANISETGLVLLINEQKGEKEEIRDEREFSWCCSFPWGFGCRGTERRLASWRAAAECSSSQSGRRSGAGFAAGSRSSCQTEAADLHG